MEVGVEFRSFEPGAFLDDMGEFAVAHDAGVGIFLGQVLQKFVHGMLLCFGTGIGSVAFSVDASFVADANRIVVVVPGMGSTCRFGQQGDDVAIHTDIVMIRYMMIQDLPYICPFAQIDVTQTIIRGINPNLQKIINQVISNTTRQLMNVIRTEVAKIQGNNAVKNTLNALNPDAIVDTLQKQISVEMRKAYTDPLLSTLDMLYKEDLANVAESLISLTSLVRRMQPGEETVGGPVDVAVISKGDGFIWIKRKHYFKPEYNQAFMMNYFK